ncbi:hypothetical protein Asch01_03117 [Acinetobacter schindleri]|uniref:DUF551 domain-containing protein n=1 Tax=Acinetobacter schindleri TaxID=108981 RepID=UPI0030A5754D
MKIKEGGVMDIQNIDLRRGDFEGMHPKAKLFGFDEDKKLYTGDGVESINDQWTTWCACIGMLCLDGKEAQAVPEWISVNDKLPPANILVLGMSQTPRNIFNIYNVMALDEFEEADVTHWMPLPDAPQEPAND